jgi:MraZ protein
VFTGEYRHAIDAKGRVAVPARFRAELAAGAVVTRWIDSCLAIFPRQAWAELANKVASLPVADTGARSFSRFLFSSAFDVELDRQGRALVPAGLREEAGLKDEAVVVGMNERIELWAPATWDAYCAAMNSPEALAQHLEGLGI